MDLSKFRIKEILQNDISHHIVCIHATKRQLDQGDSNNQDSGEISGVLIAQKTAFNEASIEALFDERTRCDSVAENDVYNNCAVHLPDELNNLKATWICPASQAHIDKYREQDFKMITETAEMYKNITLPHIEQSKFSIQWVYNILDHKSEFESVLFEDANEENGFVLLPDLKWDRKSLNSMYFTAICRRRGVKSIRDLDFSHLPLLKNIRQKGTKAIVDKYGVGSNDLRVYFHYQPSYYHLHVHFVHMRADPAGVSIGQAHLLDDVIGNIELMVDYYRRKTLHCSLKENNALYKKLLLAQCQQNGPA